MVIYYLKVQEITHILASSVESIVNKCQKYESKFGIE